MHSCDLLTALQSEWVQIVAGGGGGTVSNISNIAGAFEPVSHVGLLNKAERAGIGGPVYSWLRDYLSNRCQKVET